MQGFADFTRSFPLDGAGGLGRKVEEHAVDALHLGGDTPGDVLEQLKGHVLHGGGHGVHGVDGADDDAPLVCAPVIPHAHALDIRYCGEVCLLYTSPSPRDCS